MALPHLPRRPVIVGLVVVALIAVAFVAAALTNPWHLTGLYPLARQGGTISVLVLAGALLATAGLLAMTGAGSPTHRAVAALLASLVAIPALCVGLPVIAFDNSFRHEDEQVLAVSPDGGFSAIKSTLDSNAGRRTRIYIRSRAGLFSRESVLPAAECHFDPFARGLPPESVRFTSESTLAVSLADKPTTVIRFAPASLVPERTVMMCESSG
jgi:hypothetical protein